MIPSIRLEGFSLHEGRASAVAFSSITGPTEISFEGETCALGGLVVEGRDRTSVARLPSGREVRGIEHVFSAICGLSAFDGVRVLFEAPEPPLRDGAARAFADAIEALAPPRCDRAARVVRRERFELDGARFLFAPTSSASTRIEAKVDFPAARFGRPLVGTTSWAGDRASYLSSIATARTFGAASELLSLRARGLAAHVPEGSVVALDLTDPARAPSDADEPIRHKLLDLLGDLAPLGAPLLGELVVERPSHRATRSALARAVRERVVVVEPLGERVFPR